jgi:hypothetical protein
VTLVIVVKLDKICCFMQIYIVFLEAQIDTPLDSLMDSTMNPKVKTMEGEGVGACSLARNILGVEGHARALG